MTRKMKRRIKKLAIKTFAIVTIVGIIASMLLKEKSDEVYGYYTEYGYTTDRKQDATYLGEGKFLDTNGDVWKYTLEKEIGVGKHVVLVISNSATDWTPSDDVVKRVKEVK